MIAAVTTWMRRDIRRHWLGLAALTVAVAVGIGFAMVAAIGARRTSSAWARFEGRMNSPDAIGEVPVDQLEARLAELAGRPGVTDVAAFTYMSLSYEGYEPTEGWRTIGAFAGLTPSFLRTLYTPLIVEGRVADPDRADEFTINETGAELTGLRPGDQIVVTSEPAVVRQAGTVVGIHRGAFDVGLNGDSPSFLMTPAFGAAWFRRYLDALPPDLRAGITGAVFAAVPRAADREALLALGFGTTDDIGIEITGGLDAQSTAFAVLAALAAIGVVAAAAQTVARSTRRGADHLPTLAALGLTPSGRRAAIAATPALAAIVGSAIAPFIAVAASPLAATGLQRRLDLRRAFVLDVSVLVVGTLAMATLLAAAAAFAAARADSAASARRAQPHPSPLALPGPAGLFGGRVATGWATPSGRTTARTHVVGVTLALAATIAVAVWSATAHHVVATPASYGQTWDALISMPDDADFSDPTAVNAAQELLSDTPAAGTRIGRLVAGMADFDGNGNGIEVLEVDQAAGSWWPSLIRGRVPAARDEITVGDLVLRQFGQRIGDSIDIGGRRFTIVGEHVVPQFSNGDFGNTIAVAMAEAELDLKIALPYVLVDLADDVAVDELQQLVGGDVVVLSSTTPSGTPGPITNLGRIGGIDDLLVAVGALLALASFANGLILATRARRRDHATMSALGAARGTITSTVVWHGGVVTGLALVVAAPIGLLVGQAVWRTTASGVHVGPDLFNPWLVIATVAVFTIVGSIAVVGATAWSAARTTAAALRSE